MGDFTKNGKCSKCGSCCSNFIPLTEDEIQKLQELVKKDDTEVQIKYIPDGRIMMMCPFLIMNNENEIRKCSIYEDRPSICKLFICSNAKMKLSLEESMKYKVVDMMKDIVHYDYQKETGLTYEEAMAYHMQLCKHDREVADGKDI